jgi:hypothetical protein
MAESQFDALVQAESRLTRSFMVAVGVVALWLIWLLFIASPEQMSPTNPTMMTMSLIQLASYVWYAIAAGGAARVLGDTSWKYVVWILAAPFIAKIPIPFVSTIIAVSPLSIKFLLGSQLQEAIRQQGVASIHESTT